MTAREASRPQRPTLRAESLPNLARRISLTVIGTVLSKKALVTRISPFGQRRPSASVSDTNSGRHAESHWRATLAVRQNECRRRASGCCVSIVSITHALDKCPNSCGCFPPRIEMSWQTLLTVLTALTVVARFSTRELILIVRVPARPSRLKDISMPNMPKCARLPKPDVMGIGRPAANKARLRAHEVRCALSRFRTGFMSATVF
jgi:hypothetical protein